MGNRVFFLPWLLKPGQQPLNWDTLGMMQGLEASHAPPPTVDMEVGRRHSMRLPAAVGLEVEVVLHCPHLGHAGSSPVPAMP